jgi:hypothetical protein
MSICNYVKHNHVKSELFRNNCSRIWLSYLLFTYLGEYVNNFMLLCRISNTRQQPKYLISLIFGYEVRKYDFVPQNVWQPFGVRNRTRGMFLYHCMAECSRTAECTCRKWTSRASRALCDLRNGYSSLQFLQCLLLMSWATFVSLTVSSKSSISWSYGSK